MNVYVSTNALPSTQNPTAAPTHRGALRHMVCVTTQSMESEKHPAGQTQNPYQSATVLARSQLRQIRDQKQTNYAN